LKGHTAEQLDIAQEADGLMNKRAFFRGQAALCQRIARNFPQERIAAELMRIAADFEAKSREEDTGDTGDRADAPAWSISPTGSLRGRSAVGGHLVGVTLAAGTAEQEQRAGERTPGDNANGRVIR
jgi:hypothetical protein